MEQNIFVKNMEFLISSFECRMRIFNGILFLHIRSAHWISVSQTNLIAKKIISKKMLQPKKWFFTYTKDFPLFHQISKIAFYGIFFQ